MKPNKPRSKQLEEEISNQRPPSLFSEKPLSKDDRRLSQSRAVSPDQAKFPNHRTKEHADIVAERTADDERFASKDHTDPTADDEFFENLHQLCQTVWVCIWQKRHHGASNVLAEHSDKLKRSLGRFSLFGDFLVPHKMSEMRDHFPDLWSSILELFCEIGSLLQRLHTHMFPHQSSNDKDEPLVELLKLLSCAEYLLENSDFSLSPLDDEETMDEFQVDVVVVQLESCSRSLMDLGPTMESVYTELEGLQEPASRTNHTTFRVSEPASQFVKLILDQFPDADFALAERLGEANWQRSVRVRQAFSDAEDNHLLVEPASVFKPTSDFNDSGLGTSVLKTATFAPSVFSSYTEQGSIVARVPPAPKEVLKGDKFICPVCGVWQSNITTRTAWKLHVFKDLQPYICTHEDCHDQYVSFATREQWIQHELLKHRSSKTYKCFACSDLFGSVESLRTHLQSHETTPTQYVRVLEYALENPVMQIEPSLINQMCRICQKPTGTSPESFAKHMGRHMEAIALKSLPADVEDSDQDEASEDKSSAASASASITGKKEEYLGPTAPDSLSDIFEGKVLNERSETAMTYTTLKDAEEQSQSARREMDYPAPITEDREDLLPQSSKKHRCPHCSHEFTQRRNLKSHLLVHSEEKPFACQQCTSRFRRKDDLKRHIFNLHIGEMSHSCLKCGRKFARGDALARHNSGPGGCTGRRGSAGDGDEYSEEEFGEISPDLGTDQSPGDGGREQTGKANTHPQINYHAPYGHSPQQLATTNNIKNSVEDSHMTGDPNSVAQHGRRFYEDAVEIIDEDGDFGPYGYEDDVNVTIRQVNLPAVQQDELAPQQRRSQTLQQVEKDTQRNFEEQRLARFVDRQPPPEPIWQLRRKVEMKTMSGRHQKMPGAAKPLKPWNSLSPDQALQDRTDAIPQHVPDSERPFAPSRTGFSTSV